MANAHILINTRVLAAVQSRRLYMSFFQLPSLYLPKITYYYNCEKVSFFQKLFNFKTLLKKVGDEISFATMPSSLKYICLFLPRSPR